jgi:hypothetical protein
MKVKKQVLRFGKWNYGNQVLNITKDYANQLATNFKEYNPFVPIYRGHQKDDVANANPDLIITKNIDDLEVDGEGLNAVFDLEDEELEKYADVSVSIQPNYEDHESGDKVGDILTHIAMVTRPYIKGLKSFVKLNDKNNYLILLSEIMDKEKDKAEEVVDEEVVESKEETTKEPTAETAETPEVEEKSKEDTEKKEETLETPEESEEETKDEGEDKELSETSDSLRDQIIKLQDEVKKLNSEKKLAKAEKSFQVLLSEGKVLPVQKDSYIALAMDSEIQLSEEKTVGVLLDEFISHMPKLVNLEEQGITVDERSDNVTLSEPVMTELRKINLGMSDEDIIAKYEKYPDIVAKYIK